jgi:hypothetical protein
LGLGCGIAHKLEAQETEMLVCIVVWFTLLVNIGLATDLPQRESDQVVASYAVKPKNPLDAAKEEVEKKKSESELRAEARLAALEEMQSGKAARVVILQWPGTDINYESEALQRNVKTRIARPDAKFYPEIDLYQAGRKEPDRSIRPEEQRAVVPDSAIGFVENAIAMVETIPWNGLSPQDWGLKAEELRRGSEEIWFVDRPELREPLFKLYIQIGRAAENANLTVAPFYVGVGGLTVNYYWYLAGAMGHVDPQLMALVTDQDMHANISYYKEQLDQGGMSKMTLTFEEFGVFDAGDFAKEYEVFINGKDVIIDHAKGLWETPPGRVDVYLKRTDGHSISDRIELVKLGEKIYGVRATARLRMGNEFIDQLMEHPNECTPQVDGDILTFLAIYAKLHKDAEIYVAIPEGGSPNKVRLWRWKRHNGTLELVLDDTGGFPVRFVALMGAGFTFSGLAASPPSVEGPGEGVDPGTTDTSGLVSTTDPEIDLTPAGVPIFYHLRGHYGRLMFAYGYEYSKNVTELGHWMGAYQTDGKAIDPALLTVKEGCDGADKDDTSICPSGESTMDNIVRERDWQRLGFLEIGAVLMKDAAIGFGPRGAVRFGWYNVPHAFDLTFHLGLSEEAPIGASTGRVRPLIDVDFFAGMMLPYKDTILTAPAVTFGMTVGAGFTF